MALWSQNPIFLWLFPLVLDVGDSIVVWYNIQLNCTACRPYFLLDIMFDRKYFQKSHRKVLMMSQRNKASQYKWLFHLSDAKTFWKMYTLAQFSWKSYLCCGRYNLTSVSIPHKYFGSCLHAIWSIFRLESLSILWLKNVLCIFLCKYH